MIDWKQYIERDPDVMLGKPVFRGTRITVEFVLERLAQGASPKELVDNYEGLLPEHIPAALAYAAAVIGQEELVSLA
ncbi:MAG TPA: DUF433 domain-containing protein [Tepidisphaeraceae bacterium]|nr:DUF433 domain-containing protein [Tepidisphaeraceae bacterium]